MYRVWTLLRLMYFGAFSLAVLAALVVTGLCACCCRLPLAVPVCRRSAAGHPLQRALDAYTAALDRVGLGWCAPGMHTQAHVHVCEFYISTQDLSSWKLSHIYTVELQDP